MVVLCVCVCVCVCTRLCVPDIRMLYICVTYFCIHLLTQITDCPLGLLSASNYFCTTGITYLVCTKYVNMLMPLVLDMSYISKYIYVPNCINIIIILIAYVRFFISVIRSCNELYMLLHYL